METTIHLTGRQPVRIRPEEWPTIARAEWSSGDRPETSEERAYVRVRRHADGRTIVFGLRARGKQEHMVGFLLEGAEVGVAGVTQAIKNAAAMVGIEPQDVFDDLPPELL